MDIAPGSRKQWRTILLNEGYSLNMSQNNGPSLILSLSETEGAAPVKVKKSENDVATYRTSTSTQPAYSVSLKGDLRHQTEQSSSQLESAIPGCTCSSCSCKIIGQPSYTESVILSGAPVTDLSAQSVKPSPKSGPEKAETYDEGKAPLAHLPWAAVEALSRVQLYGHKKYKDFNNYRKGMEVSRNLSCALRHIKEYLENHDTDKESGESPLAHAMCRIAFVLQNIYDGVAIDDRYKPGLERYK